MTNPYCKDSNCIKPQLKELLDECIDHLEYCGYGDNWESECAEPLKKKIEKYRNETTTT